MISEAIAQIVETYDTADQAAQAIFGQKADRMNTTAFVDSLIYGPYDATVDEEKRLRDENERLRALLAEYIALDGGPVFKATRLKARKALAGTP